MLLLALVLMCGAASAASTDTVTSSIQCQNSGFMATNTFASVTNGNGAMSAPLGCNDTYYQSTYSENSFLVGTSMYLKNVSITAPTQTGVTHLINTNRQVDSIGTVVSSEMVTTSVMGQVPQNGTNAQRLSGSELANKLVISSSDIMANSLTMQSTNYVHNGVQDLLLPSTGLVSPLALESTSQAIISGSGFSVFYDGSISQHGPIGSCNSTPSMSAEDVYSNRLMVTGESIVIHRFTFQEQVKPPIQMITPLPMQLCSFG